jgi:hypothetical protein
MLKLNDQTVLGLNICNVLFAVLGKVKHLLAVLGKQILPPTVPFRFGFPPLVAHSATLMRPMPDAKGAAFSSHRLHTTGAQTLQTWLGFPPLLVHERKLHEASPLKLPQY